VGLAKGSKRKTKKERATGEGSDGKINEERDVGRELVIDKIGIN
jgi:hypothetical protein